MSIPYELTYFVFILARITGCIMFNQIFGRGNIPKLFQMCFIIGLSITIYGIVPPDNFVDVAFLLEYILIILRELFIGFVLGHVVKLFLSVISISGDIIDLQMGLSMAKIYDPKSNISMGLTSSIINILFILIFFGAGGHLTLINIFIFSCKVLPVGTLKLGTDVFKYAVDLFSYILIYSVKMTLPILAVELIVEVGMGIIMKAIPQIHIFVINIPLKIFIGLCAILILIPTFSSFLEKLITLMFDAMQKSLSLLM